jgi:hypothetical protein
MSLRGGISKWIEIVGVEKKNGGMGKETTN